MAIDCAMDVVVLFSTGQIRKARSRFRDRDGNLYTFMGIMPYLKGLAVTLKDEFGDIDLYHGYDFRNLGFTVVAEETWRVDPFEDPP